MLDNSLGSLHRLVWIALLAALIAIGAYLQLPLGVIPFSMQTFFVLLAGLVLGPTGGRFCAILYLSAGALGLPVFAGGTSGIARLFGPTGGFLIGFLAAATIAGLATSDRSRQLSWQSGLIWSTLAMMSIFVVGVPWLKLTMDIGWIQALSAGLIPFLPAAAIKIVLAIATYRFMYMRRLLPL